MGAQFFDSVSSSRWPGQYSGDTQFFQRNNQQIISNYNLSDKGDFQLNIKSLPKTSLIFYVRFDLELKINTSTSNSIRFGFIDSFGNTQFIKLGNTQDRWEAFISKSSTPVNSGMNQEFAASSFNGSIQLRLNSDSLIVTTYHSSTQIITELKMPLFLENIQQFFIGIQQSGKTAFQSHRISNITINTQKKQRFSRVNIKQLNQNELSISGSHLLKFNSGSIKINQKYRSHSLNPDLKSLTIQIAKSDSIDLNIQLDSLFTIWNEELEPILLFIKIKQITPIQRTDIVISEIMSVPQPSLNRFPTTEYIELYNNSNHYKKATEIKLIYNNKVVVIPDSLFPPNLPVLLVPMTELNTWHLWALNKFQTTSNIWGIPNFPNLINAEGIVLLKSQNGVLLDSVNYQVSMHTEYASNGGFSYETTNLNPLSNNCKWKTASKNGGSPAAINGSFDNLFPIEIEENYLLNDNSIAFKLNVHHQLIEEITVNSNSVSLNNKNHKQKVFFDINPKIPKPNSKLTFNEIYVKSATNTDFIEIYNPNEYPVFLEYFDLLLYDNDHFIKQIISLKNEKRKVIMPNEYLVLCENIYSLIHQFDSSHLSSLISIDHFPNFIQEGGHLALVNQLIGITDEFSYGQTKPVNRIIEKDASLEKSHPLLQSNDPNNWLDCVSELGSTPTKSNSFLLNQQIQNKKWTTILNKRLLKNPCEYYTISVELNIPELGCLMNINLFTIWGEKISSVCDYIAIPSNGVIQWPLLGSNKELLKGNYIVTFEIINPRKGIKTEHHRISLL